MRLRTGVVAVLWSAVVTTVLASCQSAPPPPTVPPRPSPPAIGCHVGLLGDSLSVRIRTLLPAALARQDCTQVWVDAAVGRSTAQGVVALRERSAAGDLPPVLVVGLGTNDQGQTAAFGGHVDSIMRLSGARPVVWIEIAHDPIKAELNAVLRRKADQWANLTIMEWDRSYWDHPEWRSSDDVHLTDLGAAERSRRIAVAASRVAK